MKLLVQFLLLPFEHSKNIFFLILGLWSNVTFAIFLATQNFLNCHTIIFTFWKRMSPIILGTILISLFEAFFKSFLFLKTVLIILTGISVHHIVFFIFLSVCVWGSCLCMYTSCFSSFKLSLYKLIDFLPLLIVLYLTIF